MSIYIHKIIKALSCSKCYSSLHITEPTTLPRSEKIKDEKWKPVSAYDYQVGIYNNSTEASRSPRQNALHSCFTNLETLHIHTLPTLKVDKGIEKESIPAIYIQKRKTSTIHSETKISLISGEICIFLLAEVQREVTLDILNKLLTGHTDKLWIQLAQFRNKMYPKAQPK